MKDRKRILEKIKKLMALTKSSNANEAANALSKAQALMAKYQIDQDEVKLIDIEHAKSGLLDRQTPMNYDALLIKTIANAFTVKPLVDYAMDGRFNLKAQIVFIGTSPQPELAAYCFDVVYRQLKSARTAYTKSLNNNCKRSTKVKRADTFCMGWVISVHAAVRAFSMSDEQTQLVAMYIQSNFGKTTDEPGKERKVKHRSDDYHKGMQAAKGVQINTPMSGNATPQLSNF